MIQVDQRHVQRQSPRFMSRFQGLARIQWLERGDMVFFSKENPDAAVCVEVKEPLDLAVCIVDTGRLVQQLRGARDAGYTQYVLTVQGVTGLDDDGWFCQWRSAPGGRGRWEPVLLPGERPVEYRRVDNALNSLAILEGVQVKRSGGERETVAQILNLYRWWQRPLDSHTTGRDSTIYSPVHLGPAGSIPLVRRVARELPGIGVERSRDVAAAMRSVKGMVEAGEEQWMGVPGIGRKTAQRAIAALRGDG